MGKLNYNKSFMNGCILQGYGNVISWDIYGTGNYITKKGWKKILDYFIALPSEAFKINKNHSMWFSFGSSYSYIELSKDYAKLNSKKIFEDIKNILENKEYMDPPNEFEERLLDKINIEEFKVWIEFKEEWEIIRSRYNYWIQKKKENSNYNRYRILERDGFKCKICGRSPPEIVLHIDHWIPKARGGLDIYENLVTLCGECNISKLAQIPKYPIEYIRDNKEIKVNNEKKD